MRLRPASRSPHRALRTARRCRRPAAAVLAFVVSGAPFAHPALEAQDAFLGVDFDDGTLGPFFNPEGTDFSPPLCDIGIPIVPSGPASVRDGVAVLTNDDSFGITILTLTPETVQDVFPESRNYTVRVRVNFTTASQFVVALKTRLGFDEAAGLTNSGFERLYSVSLFPELIDFDFPDGVVTIGEFGPCHDFVEHPEWPNAAGFDYARAAPDSAILRDEWYWVEASVSGDEDGGPVTITAKVWHVEDGEPPAPQLVAVDADGLPFDDEGRAPEREGQLAFGVSWDYPEGNVRDPGASLMIDDVTVSEVAGCSEPPARVTRTLWNDRPAFVEGEAAAVFEIGEEYGVTIELTDFREAGECDAAGGIRLIETVPAGWTASAMSDGGTLSGQQIVWELDVSGRDRVSVSYTVEPTAPGVGKALFEGQVSEGGSSLLHPAGGQRLAVPAGAIAPVSDFGTIQHWLILGPFLREVGGAAPGADQIVRDYLTDGTVTETTIRPRAGDTTEPGYGVDAASTGLADDLRGRNPQGVPTWIEWRDLDDDDDRIDFESVYGDLDEVMCYAVTYLEVEEETVVNFGVSSDDAVHVLLGGETLHVNDVARGALGRSYQDTPFDFPMLEEVILAAGQHTVVVKVFEGGGEHNFRFGFVDGFGTPLGEPPPGVGVSLSPAREGGGPELRRGDADADGAVNITDAIFLLNFLFLGGETPPCFDAADGDDSGDLNITDGISILGFLFLGTGDLPIPGDRCGEDPTADDLAECVYDRC